MADLRFAAWFLCSTPLLAALSSFFVATRRAAAALSLSPATTASRVARMAVLTSLRTALLRSVAFLLVRMRFICDLIFATSITFCCSECFLGSRVIVTRRIVTRRTRPRFALRVIALVRVISNRVRKPTGNITSCSGHLTIVRAPGRGARGLPGRGGMGEWCVHPSAVEDTVSPKALKALEPASTDPAHIRNFCIIAHIDHGKSTLADRMLQITGVVSDRDMRAQYLDRMDIERERGITIKSQAVRMPWASTSESGTSETYALNMIDTPGHVDFTYEVSRSLAACEGAILLVDAAQGIEAQTLANLYLALDNDLAIIPVLNKIDLPAADPDKYAKELAGLIGGDPADVLRVSGKTGEGVEELLQKVVDLVPAPRGEKDAAPRAMIFDSVYDAYRGVITYVRM